uniref:Uncharacterized protein n=1 Tax=Globodera rostochiensis TaxID=31243 RepID=A0A914H6Z5_GLORO
MRTSRKSLRIVFILIVRVYHSKLLLPPESPGGVVLRAYPGLDQQLTDEYAIKHFLRALDDPDLATSLELARTPGMQFDQLVTLAARAESTRKTIFASPLRFDDEFPTDCDDSCGQQRRRRVRDVSGEPRRLSAARVRSCKVAWRALADSGFHPLHLEPPPLPFGADCRAEQLGWTKLFGQASWALEVIRASLVHRRRLIDVPRVVFGDSTAAQITQNAEMTAVELLTSEEGLAGAIRALDDVVLSGKVKALLIVIGRDALLANETSETMDEHLGRIRDICSRYGHVFIFWAVPPYVHVRKLQYEEFVRSLVRLVSGTKIRLGHNSEDGRSLGEVFRYGATFAGHRVSKTGLLTEHGAKAMMAWIMDVGKFPGERELGKPRPKSQVVRVAPILATDRRPNRGRGGGLGLGDHRRLDSSRLSRLDRSPNRDRHRHESDRHSRASSRRWNPVSWRHRVSSPSSSFSSRRDRH